MKTAFKEWAVVCEALARGDQTVILRKGGISEPSSGFRPDHDEFLLMPTYLHQSQEAIQSELHTLLHYCEEEKPNDQIVCITHWAEVSLCRQVTSMERLYNLRGEHIWTDAVVEERFHRWQTGSVHALLLRVYQLQEVWTLVMKDDYGGCKSWVQIDRDIHVSHAAPVIEESEFQRRRQAVLDLGFNGP